MTDESKLDEQQQKRFAEVTEKLKTVKPYNPAIFSQDELSDMRGFLEDSWETMAETLNNLSAFQADQREDTLIVHMMAQHRITLRLLEYNINQLKGNEDGTDAGN